jgi:hypothetical protein
VISASRSSQTRRLLHSLTPNSSPFFTKGCAIGCGFTGSIVIFAFALRWRLSYINQQKDALHGPADDTEQIDVTDLGEKHPSFRYFL